MRWIRPVMSLMGMLGVTIGFFIDKIDAVAYFGLVTGVVIWWYKSRDEAKKNGV